VIEWGCGVDRLPFGRLVEGLGGECTTRGSSEAMLLLIKALLVDRGWKHKVGKAWCFYLLLDVGVAVEGPGRSKVESTMQ
jgi:hypothetical protein